MLVPHWTLVSHGRCLDLFILSDTWYGVFISPLVVCNYYCFSCGLKTKMKRKITLSLLQGSSDIRWVFMIFKKSPGGGDKYLTSCLICSGN